MKISQNGIDFIKRQEGCRLRGYRCQAGVWTIGYGHTGYVNGKNITADTWITLPEAEKLLKDDLVRYENYVNQYVPFKLNQNQFDALVSFTYNCGAGNLRSLVRNRDAQEVSKKILLYNKAAGKVESGLERRRKEEQQMFLTPVLSEVGREVVMKGKVVIDGVTHEVNLINKDGHNYVKLRDVAPMMGYNITAKGSTPVLTKK